VHGRHLEADKASILSLYKALIGLRRGTRELITGHCEAEAARGSVDLSAPRPGSLIVVVSNPGSDPVSVALASIGNRPGILLSTLMDRKGDTSTGWPELRGNEVCGHPRC